MTARYEVGLTPAAEEDLERLGEYLLERAETLEELEHAESVMNHLRVTIRERLAENPWAFRKAGDGRCTTRRELVIAQGATGYVAQFEIESATRVQVLAVRHQREEDYH